MYRSIIAIVSGAAIVGYASASPPQLAKAGVYTMSATVLSSSSATGCPFGIGASTTAMAGYTAFAGFQSTGSAISLNQDWVLAISPTTSEPKFGYDLKKSQGILGASAKFEGDAIYGGVAGEFSGKHGSYKIVVNPTTLASMLTVRDDNCIITYSLSFTRSIPAKFLNLL